MDNNKMADGTSTEGESGESVDDDADSGQNEGQVVSWPNNGGSNGMPMVGSKRNWNDLPFNTFKPILLLQHTTKIFLSLFLRLLLLHVRHYSHLARLRSLFFLVYQLLQFRGLFPNHGDFPLVKFYGILGRRLHKVSGTILDEVHFLTLKWTTQCTLLELARVPSI